MVENTCVGCLLLMGSISDIRTRKISVKLLLLFGILAISYHVFLKIFRVGEGIELLFYLMAVIPGAAMIGLAKVSRESIGYGDGYLLVVIGLFLGIKRTIVILTGALFITALSSMWLLVGKRAGLKKELPFIPALLAAFLLQTLERTW